MSCRLRGSKDIRRRRVPSCLEGLGASIRGSRVAAVATADTASELVAPALVDLASPAGLQRVPPVPSVDLASVLHHMP